MALSLPADVVTAYVSRMFVGRDKVPALVAFLFLSEADQDAQIKSDAKALVPALEGSRDEATATAVELDKQIAEINAL